MRRFVCLQLLLSCLLCQAATAANAELDKKITDTTSRLDAITTEQTQLLHNEKKIDAEIAEKENEQKTAGMKLSQWELAYKKLTILTNEGDKKAAADMHRVQFEIKRTQFNITKLDEAIIELKKELDNTRKQKRILNSQDDELQIELANLTKLKPVATESRETEHKAIAKKTVPKPEPEKKPQPQVEPTHSMPETKPAQSDPEIQLTQDAPDTAPNQEEGQPTNSNSLPLAESALKQAMARARNSPANLQPVFADAGLTLQVANPPDSAPKTIGMLKHLGNNQYMLETQIRKGQQAFILGEYRFYKNIPKHFDNIQCLILIDARDKKNPVFDLIASVE